MTQPPRDRPPSPAPGAAAPAGPPAPTPPAPGTPPSRPASLATFTPAQDPAAQVLQQDVRRLLVRGRHPSPGLPAGAPRSPRRSPAPPRAPCAPEAQPPASAPRPEGSRVPHRLRAREQRRQEGRHFDGTRRNAGPSHNAPLLPGARGCWCSGLRVPPDNCGPARKVPAPGAPAAAARGAQTHKRAQVSSRVRTAPTPRRPQQRGRTAPDLL